MKYTTNQIARIVAETVYDTCKDLRSLAKAIILVAETTSQVMEALSHEEEISLQPYKTRNLQRDLLSHKVLEKLREGE